MAETDVKCVKLKSAGRSIYRMNKFYGIHCYQCLVTGLSRTCHGHHREVGITEFGLVLAVAYCAVCSA